MSQALDGPVLITGGAGFLGVNLAERMLRDGQRVRILDNLARAGVEENLAWLRGRHGASLSVSVSDIRDPASVEQCVADAGAVLHLAAQVAVTTSIDDPMQDFEINAAGTLTLLEAIRRRPDPPPVLFASTNKVYGQLLADEDLENVEQRWQPRSAARRKGCDERTPLDFHSPYGCSKGVADQYMLDYARVFGLRTLVFRMSCLYGPHQRGTEDQGWLAHFLIQALHGRAITLYGDGCQVRDVLYVEDAVDAWVRALRNVDRLSGRAFNLGGGADNSVSLRETLELIAQVTGTRPVTRFGDWRPGDQRWYVSDTAAFTAATGWQATTSVRSGLRRLHEWLVGNPTPALVEAAA